MLRKSARARCRDSQSALIHVPHRDSRMDRRSSAPGDGVDERRASGAPPRCAGPARSTVAFGPAGRAESGSTLLELPVPRTRKLYSTPSSKDTPVMS